MTKPEIHEKLANVRTHLNFARAELMLLIDDNMDLLQEFMPTPFSAQEDIGKLVAQVVKAEEASA